ncbi:hypothetical protein CROQUDRAFT_713145 [Cronartium quercuum f. sp. fusiforme G11]|uniref:Uncharacterized protein n=1 Tax=Cronartium quercuum f. sp. fusiforme G11 TaxID=708437 RepID=A0A9P6NV90_9BASI|nr:hypothetical protein CROQUDRAFT_713145 [Cronartium quercuum f. sp. fusiforme G11]
MLLTRLRFSSAGLLGLASCVKGQDDQRPTITTPMNVVQCTPVKLTVGGGIPPYYVSIIPGGEPAAAPLETFPILHDAGELQWVVSQPPGKKLTFQVRDSKGSINYSQATTVTCSKCSPSFFNQPGGDCSKVSPFGVISPDPTGGSTPTPAPNNSTAPMAPPVSAFPATPASSSTPLPTPPSTSGNSGNTIISPLNATGVSATQAPSNTTGTLGQPKPANRTSAPASPTNRTSATASPTNRTSAPASTTPRNQTDALNSAKKASANSVRLSSFDGASVCGSVLGLITLLTVL